MHGYDLTRIFVSALKQAMRSERWSAADTAERRSLIRAALENLEEPVEGILRTYSQPFRPYNVHDPDAHEALGLADLCVARFAKNGRLMLPDTGMDIDMLQ